LCEGEETEERRNKMRVKCLLNHDLPPGVSKSSSLTQGRKFKYLPLELADHHREDKQRGIGKHERERTLEA
jgi:hypothetical protein